MNNSIDFLHLSSKLPGYLFVLANLTNPGDVVHLNCPEEKNAFLSSMLAQIGLSVQSCTHDTDENALKPIIIHVYEDLQDIWQNKSNDATEILLLPYQIPIQQFEHCAMDILHRYPNYIIIDELQDQAESKTFAVALSKESHFYAQMKQKIERFNLI